MDEDLLDEKEMDLIISRAVEQLIVRELMDRFGCSADYLLSFSRWRLLQTLRARTA